MKVLENMFWESVINDQRPKLKLKVNGIEIVSLVDTGTDITIIYQRSWNSEWPLPKVCSQFLGTGKLYETKCTMGQMCETGMSTRKVKVLCGWHTHMLIKKGTFTTVDSD